MSKRRSQIRTDNRLDIPKVLEEFEREEESSPHRKDAFKIDKPFDEALDTILKSHSQPKLKKPTGRV